MVATRFHQVFLPAGIERQALLEPDAFSNHGGDVVVGAREMGSKRDAPHLPNKRHRDYAAS